MSSSGFYINRSSSADLDQRACNLSLQYPVFLQVWFIVILVRTMCTYRYGL